MARKRMIDPSLWQDEGMAELNPRQQLLYIGLIANADDEGRLKGSASAIRLTLPTLYVGCELADIECDIAAVLVSFRQLVRYDAGGRTYIAFRNYRKWQKIERPSPSILPPPPDDSVSPHRTLTESSPTVRSQVKLKEEKLSEERENAPPLPPAPEPPDVSPPDGGGRVRAAPKPSLLNAEDRASFEEWYPRYPNKQHRPEAERAWSKLRPDRDLLVVLLGDIEARKHGRKWAEGYIEHPATYLNNRVWEDDIEPVRMNPPVRAAHTNRTGLSTDDAFAKNMAHLKAVGRR